MTTPSGVTIHAVPLDGDPTDITEGVQALYDLVIQSMDWGSGFLSIEDVEPIAKLAKACGFSGAEAADKYIEQRREDARRVAEMNRRRGA